MENKILFWGTLDVAARTLEDIPAPFLDLYERGEYRMRAEDVKRMEAYLKRTTHSVAKIRKTLNLFKAINK